MSVLHALESFVTSLLIAYLGFTNSLAHTIEARFSPDEPIHTQTEVALGEPPNQADESGTHNGAFGVGSEIARALRDATAYQDTFALAEQRAAVGTLGDTESGAAVQALVNVYCEYSTDTFTRTTTGTGFFIDASGIILTNAHVAQFLLLREVDHTVKDASCIIRAGDPATPRYRAELLFISPSWIARNAHLIREELPRGTGEFDYALLYVTAPLTGDPLPDPFPALSISTELLPRTLTGSVATVLGYPAEKLFREGARATLTAVRATTTITELYTFGSNYADIFSLAHSPIGQHGSSGGPVLRDDSTAIGMVVTKGDVAGEGTMSLRALTLSYVDRAITDETGQDLRAHLRGDVKKRSSVFRETLAPFLSRLLAFEMR